MRKFLVVLLLPAFIITSRVVSTEKQLPYSSQEIYYLTESDYGFYYKETLETPMVYGETTLYANEDLVKESGKLTPETAFKIVEWRLNRQGVPVFKLDNHQFILADKRLVYDQSHVQTQNRQVWLEPGFVIYNSPYDAKEISSTLSPYQHVTVDRTLFAEGQEFLHIDQVGWVSKEFVSEEDNRIQKVQEILSNNYQNENYSIYVKQLSTGKEAGVNEGSKLYAASILKLAYLYYAQDKINQGDYTLDSSFKYIPEVNSFPGSYKPEGSGSLPKKEVGVLLKELDKLEKYLGGIKDMPRIPDVMFIVDPRKERIAVQEAHKLNIPIVAMVDTNCDPDEIDVVIPSNDDAIRAVKLIVAKMADAFVEGNQGEDVAVDEEDLDKDTSLEDIEKLVEGDNAE